MLRKAAAGLPAAFFFIFAAVGLRAAENDGRLKVVMLGDSLTFGYDWAGALPEYRMTNLGVSGDTARRILARLEAVSQAEPDIVFLQVGINDLAGGVAPERILEGHQEIWRRLGQALPLARLVVVSMFPVEGRRYDRFNPEIRKINNLLRQTAENAGLPFLDFYPALADQNGCLRPDFTFDGLHLLAPAYELWVRALRPILAKADNDRMKK